MAKASTIIKAHTAQSLPMSSLRAFHLNDVMDEARTYVAQAHAEAENLVRQAEDRLRKAEQQARLSEEEARKRGDERGYQEGFERGVVEGREAGRKEAFEAASSEFAQQQANLIESCKAIISAIDADRGEWQTAARQDLIELAVAIARRVARHVGLEHREVVLANLEEAVRLVGTRTDVTIAVNPLDAEAARAFAKSLIDMREQWQKIRVVDEPEISPGGCRVQWGSGSIDATLETQLDRIDAELNAGMKK